MHSLKLITSFRFTSTNGSNLEDDLNTLKELAKTLKAACASKTSIEIDNLIGLITLAALPPIFNSVRAVIENAAEKDTTILEFVNLE